MNNFRGYLTLELLYVTMRNYIKKHRFSVFQHISLDVFNYLDKKQMKKVRVISVALINLSMALNVLSALGVDRLWGNPWNSWTANLTVTMATPFQMSS